MQRQLICPKCRGQMGQYERGGVVIDQCIECRGIFLDRGELERLIDAEAAWHGGAPGRQPTYPQGPPYAQPQYPQGPQRQPYRDYDSDEYPVYGQPGHEQQGHGKRKKHRGFLEELFD